MASAAAEGDRARVRRRTLDILLAAIALAVALPALWYPYGRDQAVVDYAARALLAGHLPYTAGSVAVARTPGVIYTFALAHALLGPHQWSIRVLELATVLLLGWLVCRLVWERAERRDGAYGASMLLVATLHYGLFDYWDTAQQEIWESTLLVGATLAALEIRGRVCSTPVVGALAGAAFMFKYPAAIPATAVAGICVWRALRGASWPPLAPAHAAATTLGLFAAGAGAAILLTLSPHVLGGALDEFWEVAVEYVVFYAVQNELRKYIPHWYTFAPAGWYLLLAGALALVACIRGRLRGDERVRAVILVALLGSGIASIWVQRLFFAYHWNVLVGPAAGLLLLACKLAAGRRSRWAAVLATALAAAVLAWPPPWASNPDMDYRRYAMSAWERAGGRITRDEFLGPFQGGFGYDYREQEYVATVVREHAQPGDTLCVEEEFDPLFYTISGLTCPSRFPIRQGFAFKGGKWRREHEAVLAAHPPTFVLLYSVRAQRVAALEASGYHGLPVGPFVVLVRGAGASGAR